MALFIVLMICGLGVMALFIYAIKTRKPQGRQMGNAIFLVVVGAVVFVAGLVGLILGVK